MKPKSIFTILSLAFIFISCSKDESQSDPLPELGITLISPTINTDNIGNSITFKWNVSGTLASDSVVYEIFLGVEEDDLNLIKEDYLLNEFSFPKLLTNENTYFWKIKATDNKGRTVESPVWNFSTVKINGEFTDSRDNDIYKWVQIGNQKWMSENLRFRMSDESIAPENDENNVAIYGRYYSAAEAYVICPSGWRLPSNADFNELIEFVGIEREFGIYGYENLLKSTTGWNNNYNGNNKSGFNVFPSGAWYSQSGYSELGIEATFWTSTIETENEASIFGASENLNYFWLIPRSNINIYPEKHCVRCIMN